jgi:hypothetical protein
MEGTPRNAHIKVQDAYNLTKSAHLLGVESKYCPGLAEAFPRRTSKRFIFINLACTVFGYPLACEKAAKEPPVPWLR